MIIHLIAAGTKPDAWLKAGYDEYARRFPPECRLALTEISLARRAKGASLAKGLAEEGGRMLAAVPKNSHIVALAVADRCWDTAEVAHQLEGWMGLGKPVAMLIGGPDGLAPACLERTHQHWSLSPLSFPHLLVRILVAEQLYRAWTLLRNHPYHR